MSKAAASSELARTGLAPRGLSREQAAAYVGVSTGMLDAMIAAGRMPAAKCMGRRLVWDRLQLDQAFEALPAADADAAGGQTAAVDDVWGRARA